MRRITKNLLTFLSGILLTAFYCEFIIYYVVIAQCTWPDLNTPRISTELKALIIADTHLLGPRKGHWLDKWRREWQMQQAFQSIMTLHKPETVFVLGDLFDEGEWSSDKQFQDYVERFYKLFSVPDSVTMQNVVGNHDIGFHYNIRPGSAQRFFKSLNTSSVKMVTLKDIHFILLNSMAMEGDSCGLCREARFNIEKISRSLECSKYPHQCEDVSKLNYSRPILMQHFPLYRISDAQCTEPDAPPLPQRHQRFRNKIDALSPEATKYLTSKIQPRAVFGGHTHHGCLVHHKGDKEDIEFYEYSVPSFSWRNRPDPKYMLEQGQMYGFMPLSATKKTWQLSAVCCQLQTSSRSFLKVTLTPESYAVIKCGLPKETTIAITAVILVFMTCYYSFRTRLIGRR